VRPIARRCLGEVKVPEKSHHRPADGEQRLRLGPLHQASLQRDDELVALFHYLILGLEDLLPLTAQSPDLLQGIRERHLGDRSGRYRFTTARLGHQERDRLEEVVTLKAAKDRVVALQAMFTRRRGGELRAAEGSIPSENQAGIGSPIIGVNFLSPRTPIPVAQAVLPRPIDTHPFTIPFQRTTLRVSCCSSASPREPKNTEVRGRPHGRHNGEAHP